MPKRPSSLAILRNSKRLRREEVTEYDPGPTSSADADETIPEDSDDEIRPNTAITPPKRRPKQADVQMTQSDDDESEDEDDYELSQQESRAAVSLAQKNGHSLAGILHSVKLDRFMSHDCFQYELGPNVNIISGRNGSGKSAIVAALQIGLGARATATERASKLEDHIMHGKESSVITVNIRNRRPPNHEGSIREADLTYRHEEFGDSIIIERRLMKKRGKSGPSSSWAVRGARGRITFPKGHTPAKEVKNIIDHFGFMVDNPVAILTQTKAKQFLAGRKPAQHYNLFREATLLAPLEKELEDTKKVTGQVQRILTNTKNELPNSERELEKLRIQYEEAKELKNIDKRIDEARVLWAWTVVDEAQNEVTRMQDHLANQLQPEHDAHVKAHENTQKKLDKLYASQQNFETIASDGAHKTQQAGELYKNAQKQVARLEMEMQRQQRLANSHQQEIQQAKHQIQTQNNRMESARREHFAGQEQKSLILQQVEDLKSREEELDLKIEDVRKQETSISEKRMKIDDEYKRAQGERHRWMTAYEDKLREQRQVEEMNRRKTSVGRFGAVFEVLDNVIRKNARRFHMLPVGPLGQYLTIQDDSWARAIEMAIGPRKICAYIVHSSDDAKLLKDLFDEEKRRLRRDGRNFRMPTVFVSELNDPRYPIQPRDLPDLASHGYGELKTILETVNISHDAVFNALVDHGQIESIVLNHFDEDLQKLGWMQLDNVSSVWNKQCERAYSRGGGNVFRRAPPPGHARFLTKDMSGYLQDIVQQVEQSFAEKQLYEQQYEENKSALQHIQSELQGKSRETKVLQKELFQCRRKRQPLQDQLEQAENAFDPSSYERAIADQEESIEREKREFQNSENEAKDQEQRKQEHAAQVGTAKEELRRAKLEATKASEDLKGVVLDVKKMRSRSIDLRKKSEEAQSMLAEANETIEERHRTVLEHIEKAKDFGTRPDDVNMNSISSDKLKKRVQSLKRKLENEQQRRGGLTAEQIEESYLKFTKKFEDLQSSMNRVESYEVSLIKGIANREKKQAELSKSSRRIVRTNFKRFLEIRGHTGNILFRRNENGVRELHITTKLKSHVMRNGECHETKELSSLSGGEKSMTTLCFLLAMAEMCQNPLRVFDEIDVYQDDASRRASYKTIIHTCTKYLSNRQIILITPCKLPNFDETPSLKIVRMPDPRPDNSNMRQSRISNFASQVGVDA